MVLYQTQAAVENIWWLIPPRFVQSIRILNSKYETALVPHGIRNIQAQWSTVGLGFVLSTALVLVQPPRAVGEHWHVTIQED